VAGLGLVVSLLVPTLAAAAEAPSARKSVLLLYAESRVVPAIFRLDESIRSRFVTAGVAAEFSPEYLDLSWAAEPGHTTDLLAFLRSKHRRRKFDVVMAAGSTALGSRSPAGPSCFRVPIVFCAVTRAGTDGLQLDRDVTGVWMVPEAAATVARRGGPSSWHRDPRQRRRESAGVGQRSGRRSPGRRPAAGLRAFYTTKAHGLGMGLSIVRSLIQAHGGQVWASNNADGGATFTFTLPPDGPKNETNV
jgi:hypothetical protein